MAARRRDDLSGELFDFPIRPQVPAAEQERQDGEPSSPHAGDLAEPSPAAQELLFEPAPAPAANGFWADDFDEPAVSPHFAAPDREGSSHHVPAEEVAATAGERLWAGLIDVFFHAVAAGLAFGAALGLGVPVTWDHWPGFALFVACFSFLYVTVPLAFWGHTPGMAWLGLKSSDLDGRPLAFSQAARRWLASLITVSLVGLPLLIALGGRSLADRMSVSRTFAELDLEDGE